MKKSIRRQISVIFIGLVCAVLLLAVLINSQFLENFYVHNKKETLINVYKELDEAAEENELTTEETRAELGELVESGNITFVVIDQMNEQTITATPNDIKAREMTTQLIGYLLNRIQVEGKIYESNKEYQIHKTFDRINGGEYIEMWGFLEGGQAFLLRSPLESIRESVMLANEFLIYIGIGVALIGSFLVGYFSKRITKPILELTNLSKSMADLNFDVRYTSGGQDEIGVLGANFNSMSDKLEKTISELKTANYELQKDIERKEKMEVMRTDFIGNVSHELKTPIALIKGYAEGLKEGISEDPESREFYCDVILDEANKMNQMVKNLLTLNQLEYGEEEVSFTRFNLLELIEGVLQSLEIMIQQKEVKVQLSADETVYVWADEYKVEQVLRNYLSNAMNHAAGEKIVDIRIRLDKERETARVSVFNTGKPIPEEDVENIWNKFYKVDKARTREYGGHGIGLSIVKAIMDSLQKECGVKNYENGVAFWFELDLK